LQNEIIRPELTTGNDADIAQATYKHLLKLRAKKMAASDADDDDKAPASLQPETSVLPVVGLATSPEASAVSTKPE
jgi:hypothetical protein